MQSGEIQVYETPPKAGKRWAAWLAIFFSLAAGIGAYALYF